MHAASSSCRISLMSASPLMIFLFPSKRVQTNCKHCVIVRQCTSKKVESQSNSGFHSGGKNVDIIVTYSDPSGAVRIKSVKSSYLSVSWVWNSPSDENHGETLSSKAMENLFQNESSLNGSAHHSRELQERSEMLNMLESSMHPVKLERRKLRLEMRQRRTLELMQQSKEIDNQMEEAAIVRERELDKTINCKYGVWRKKYENPNSDLTVRLMRDQIIMARTYATIAKAKTVLYDSLLEHSGESQLAIGEANSDTKLLPSALDLAKRMGHILATAKDLLYDCITVARKLRAMLQSAEGSLNALKKKSAFLIQLAAKTVPKPLHRVPLLLTTEYFLCGYEDREFPNKEMIEDPSLYHYAIFSDIVLAASVVVNSTVLHAKEPDKHVFQSCNRNPEYLSMLNHLRFYLPEVYPKLDKIMFLDDDIVVQKDLTPLWSVDLKGMLDGALETCKESLHRFDKYLNFSNPKISKNFDPNACGWAFGMNMFDLKEWRKHSTTGIYHYWQDMNEDRTLWKLRTLPPGLITFYNLTYPLERSWHVLELGYDPALHETEIENGAVLHYNGNYKPWLDLAISKYKFYWCRYVMSSNPYLQLCNIEY